MMNVILGIKADHHELSSSSVCENVQSLNAPNKSVKYFNIIINNVDGRADRSTMHMFNIIT